MSHALIARNVDLKRIEEYGYTIRFLDGYLLIHDVPYVTSVGEIAEATLAMQLDLSGESTCQPGDHVAYWTGEFPYDGDLQKLEVLGESSHNQFMSNGTKLTYMFSAKPEGGRYRDYEHKVRTYVEIITREARKINSSASAQKWKVAESDSDSSVFAFMETASARQNTSDLASRLEGEIVAIVGLGGTGAYILDYVAKTWVKEIHLYDDDRFLQHNSFRVPGAVAAEELDGGPIKSVFHSERYSRMRRGIFAHPTKIMEENVDELKCYDTVFLCIDGHAIKQSILGVCEDAESVCIDTGMGIYREGDRLGGILRTTTSEPGNRDHVVEKNRIDMAGGDVGEYERNIQLAELNALNAALAVIKWKKIRGVFQDLVYEGDSGYVLDGNKIINRDYIECAKQND